MGNTFIGKNAFDAVQSGKKVGITASVRAYCYDCMGFYEDGKMDCKNLRCPLYSWMPYKDK